MNLMQMLVSLKNVIEEYRDSGFAELRSKVMSGRARLEQPEPVVFRLRKAPRRFESESTLHHFSIPEEYNRRMYIL